MGNKVSIGNLEDCVIADVLENGKIYEIDYTNFDNNYGNPIRTKHSKGFWTWLNVRPLHRKHNQENDIIKNEDLRFSYSQRDIMGLLYNVYSFGTNVNPIFQRGYVWEMSDNVALIDSIFHHIDIGKFVFIHNDYGDEYLYEILDGKQRLNALTMFYENRFSYKGLFYNDLSRHEQYIFDTYSVSYAEIHNTTEEQKIRYFLNMNTSGKVMDKEHLDRIAKLLEK